MKLSALNRGISVLLTILILCVPLSGCSGDEVVFRCDVLGEPTNLDPQLTTEPTSLLVIQNTCEGLLSRDESGALVPGVASSYSVSPDGLQYTFTLDNGSVWIQKGEVGEKVTAPDFVFAFQRIFDKATNSPYVSQFMCIKNARQIVDGELAKEAIAVYATSNTELKIELAYANDSFLSSLATTAAMPCNQKFFTDTKGKYGLNLADTAFNGPFLVSSWKKGKSLVLIKSSHYRDSSAVTADTIVLYPGRTEEETLSRFMDGTTDILSVSGDKIESLVRDGFGYAQFQDTAWALVLNPNDPALSNINIRLALAQSFTQSSYQNQLPMWLNEGKALIPPVVTAGELPYRQAAGLDFMLPYLPENALQCLETGLEELELYDLPKISVLCPDDATFPFLLQFVQQTWQSDLSTFINLSPVPKDTIASTVANGSYQMALMPFKTDSDSAEELLSAFMSDSPKNIVGYSDPQYDEMMRTALSTPSQSEARANLLNAEHKLIDEGIIIPFAFQTSYYALSKNTEGIAVSPFGGRLSFKYAHRVKK